MRLKKKSGAGFAEGDMTPMIDMTFQLIAFFMVLVNFTEAEQNERIRLPSSELAKPPDAPFEAPLTLQVTSTGTVIFGGQDIPVSGLKMTLLREAQLLKATPDRSVADATIIIRADQTTKTGIVQEVIQACQETGFERFALRAKQQERST
ncbi:MAG TPA: biopolymer transporter ExbD [Thermoguttaceae bacterium]|nr:biopolymer transporter ExbD [Thermoguttaceae bacterium]